jgi:hypothetical protein
MISWLPQNPRAALPIAIGIGIGIGAGYCCDRSVPPTGRTPAWFTNHSRQPPTCTNSGFSFSKVLFPGLRVGYLVVPESQIDRLSRICQWLYRDRPIFNQTIVTDFLMEGHFARHITRMRALYSERRSALAAALVEVFGDQMNVRLREGGMHLLARFANCRRAIWRAFAALPRLPTCVFSKARPRCSTAFAMC